MSLTDLLFYASGSGSVDVDVVMAPAVSGAVAYGPIVAVEGEVVPPLVVRVLDRDDQSTTLGTLDQSFGRGWQDQVSEPGGAWVSLDNSDPDLALIDDNTVLRFEVENYGQFLMLPAEREQVTVAPGEEHDQVTTIKGPGNLAVLAESVVYPSRGVESIPVEEDRVFSWPSPDYDDTNWVAATEIVEQGLSGEWWVDLPSEFWPDPEAFWIWASQGSETTAPEGTCYFRRTFTMSEGALVIVFFTIDDAGSFFIDGLRMDELDVGQRTEGTGPNEIRWAKIMLGAGDHVFAVQGYNSPPNPADPPGTTNPAGFLCAAYEVSPLGSLGTQIMTSDSEWKVVEYPPSPPGMTPGQVARILIEESVARGCANVEMLFDDEVDTNGNPWPVVGDIATKVGTDYLTFFREMSGTYWDMWMPPFRFELRLFSLGEMTRITPIDYHPPTDENDPNSGNLAGLIHRRVT